MPNDPIPEPTPVDHTSLSTHYLSQGIMHQQNMSTHGVPKSTTADGNCFFHVISLALYGTKFNLGTFFATTLVYKNQRVTGKETKDHPIFAEPMLLHKDASYQTCRAFLSPVCRIRA